MRILFVAHGHSIHTARWIGQFDNEGWDRHLFPSDKYIRNLHPDFRNLTVHGLFRSDVAPVHESVVREGLSLPQALSRGRGVFTRILSKMPGDPASRITRLATVVRAIRPDLVHSMEWGAGVLTLEAHDRLAGRFPPWIHSSWGSDLYYFGRRPDCASEGRRLFSSCDYLMADCLRELELAPDFGFAGEDLGVFPGAGGYRIAHMRTFRSEERPSARRLILLKGRHGETGGCALPVVHALRACAAELSGYEVGIFNASDIVASAATEVMETTGLRIRVVPSGTSHDEMMKLMGRARISVGASTTDGTPQAMLEAMVMGAFPIQTDAADTRGWIDDGVNGLLMPCNDIEAAARAIRRAVADDGLVDKAADINASLTAGRIDVSILKPRIVDIYQRVRNARLAEA